MLVFKYFIKNSTTPKYKVKLISITEVAVTSINEITFKNNNQGL